MFVSELPEVETVKRVTKPQISGLKIGKITVNRAEVISRPTAEEFCEQLTGQIVSGMPCRGKFLIIGLKSGGRIILHLRMTGCLLVTPKEYPLENYTHVIFEFKKRKCVFPTLGVLVDFG